MKENKQAEKPERKGEKEQTVVKASDTKKNERNKDVPKRQNE